MANNMTLKQLLLQLQPHPFNSLFSRTTWVNQHQKGKPFWILMKQEMMGGSGVTWMICKSFVPHSRQITTPIPHHSSFVQARYPSYHPTNSIKAHIICPLLMYVPSGKQGNCG